MKTYGDLIQAIIDHYKKCLNEYPYDGMYIEKEYFLEINKVAYGICFCAANYFNISLTRTSELVDIMDHMTHQCMYITRRPSAHCDSRQIKEAFELRIKKMEEYKPFYSKIDLNIHER